MALMSQLINTNLSPILYLVSIGLKKEDEVDLNLKILVQFLAFAPDIFSVSAGKTFNPSVSQFHMYKTGMKIRSLSHPFFYLIYLDHAFFKARAVSLSVCVCVWTTRSPSGL